MKYKSDANHIRDDKGRQLAVVMPTNISRKLACDLAGLCAEHLNTVASGQGASLGFDVGYVHAYLKSALLMVEPEGLTDPQAAYFFEWLERTGGTR